MFRKLHMIATEIVLDWENMSPHARPYVGAMSTLSEMGELYGAETGREIVQRFLVNANSWKGDKARTIKSELRDMVKNS